MKDYLQSISSEKKKELFRELFESLSAEEKTELVELLLPLIIKELDGLPEKLKKEMKKVL